MNISEENNCPKCGAPYARAKLGGFGGLCPRCLLAGLLAEPESDSPWQAGTRIGRYTLVESLGTGGMGSVWQARQEEPISREVAIKFIKPGMDTREVISRFDAERQVLARLDHPNIASIFDAGATEAGRPYYVMELVAGVSVTDYCAQHRLPVPERLTLFSKICHAVQHAHERGVVHRDLKPENILVADHLDGRFKIIDFGIARTGGPDFAEQTFLTMDGHIVGTPGYMSPEQADGSVAVDGRSDVYALGALLYEMLSGSPPFSSESLRRAGLLEMVRIIKEEQPPKPSTRLHAAASAGNSLTSLPLKIHPDLDWISLKALAKDPAQRYPSPAAFSEDIGRHLRREPVSASAPGIMRRTGLLVRRHRTPVIAAAAALLAAAATIAVIGFMRDRPAGTVDDPFAPGPEIALWKLVGPAADGPAGGGMERSGDTITFGSGVTAKDPSVFLPVHPAGSWRLELKMKKHDGNHGLAFAVLPIGDALVSVVFMNFDTTALEPGAIGQARGQPQLALGPFFLQNAPVEFVVRRFSDSDSVSISVQTGGREVLAWDGKVSALPKAAPGRRRGIEIGFAQSNATITAPTLRPLGSESGVVFLRPEELGKLESPGLTQTARVFAARQFLSVVGHKIELIEDGSRRSIFRAQDVPAGPFEVTHLHFGSPGYSAGELPLVLTFPEVTNLWMAGPVSDDDFGRLGTLAQLQNLVLIAPVITGDGLRSARGFPALRELHLQSCGSLPGTIELPPLPSLEFLQLLGTSVTDVTKLAAIPTLTELQLHTSGITDEGLNFPSPPPKLRTLLLNKLPAVTDACLAHVARIPTLKRVHLGNTPAFTREGAEALHRALPACDVVFGQSGAFETFPAQD